MISRLLALLSVSIAGCLWPMPASGLPYATKPTTLDALYNGYAVNIKERYAVSRVEVDDIDVTELFVLEPRRPTAWNPGRNTYATIKVRNLQSLRRLQTLLARQKTPRLTLHLEDDGWIGTIYRTLPQRVQISTDFESTVDVLVDLTPCEVITAIIYQNIDFVLKTAIEQAGQTRESVTLDDVFKLLLKGQVEPFIARLKPLDARHECFTTFSLLNWLRQSEAQGFEFSEYSITADLKEILGRVASSLRSIQAWERYQFSIYVTGYTDDIRFDKEERRPRELPLLAEKTAVRSLKDPLEIWYAGCSVDVLDNGPIYIPLDSTSQRGVGELVDNNCELGAVRAYVALAFLRQVLGTGAVEYRYATGGISPAAPKGRKDASTRKAEIRFRVMAARQSKGLPSTTAD